MKPVFYLLAGPNGAGKSTLYRSAVASGLLPAHAEFVNADLYEASHLQHITDLKIVQPRHGHGLMPGAQPVWRKVHRL